MEEKNVVKFKKEEFSVKEYIKTSLGKGKVSKVKIEYTPIGEKIIVSTNKPGLVVGRKGERISELTRVLKNQFKLENPHIEIDEILQPEFDAQIMADEIALGIERFGSLKFKVIEHDLKKIPKTKTHIMVNVAIPDSAFALSFLPNRGVGLAREEFIIASKMGVHPLALLNMKKLAPAVRKAIEVKMRGWTSPTQYYIDNLAFGIAKIGAAFHPNPVIVRFSDFKTNEYRTLLGGEKFEPQEENPMLGWRGASRYYDPKFKPAFMLEVAALKKVREDMGLTNVIPMVPFCRTVEEGIKVQEVMAEGGLVTKYMTTRKAKGSIRVYQRRNLRSSAQHTPVLMMCEIPSNVLLANEFLDIFDGMSIGSNDLTQLTLGLDRDSGIVTKIANENNEAVKKLIADVIKICRGRRKYIGICGQGPSDYPDFAAFLVEKGIESMSLNPDTVVRTTIAVAKKEKGRGR